MEYKGAEETLQDEKTILYLDHGGDYRLYTNATIQQNCALKIGEVYYV